MKTTPAVKRIAGANGTADVIGWIKWILTVGCALIALVLFAQGFDREAGVGTDANGDLVAQSGGELMYFMGLGVLIWAPIIWVVFSWSSARCRWPPSPRTTPATWRCRSTDTAEARACLPTEARMFTTGEKRTSTRVIVATAAAPASLCQPTRNPRPDTEQDTRTTCTPSACRTATRTGSGCGGPSRSCPASVRAPPDPAPRRRALLVERRLAVLDVAQRVLQHPPERPAHRAHVVDVRRQNAREWHPVPLPREGTLVQATGITANLSVPDIGEARDFYVDYLGLSVEGFNMGWVARLQSPDGRAVVSSSPATQPLPTTR